MAKKTLSKRNASRTESMGGLAKGLSIIESFSAVKPKLSISDAAAASGISPASARRCLLTLQELGFVAHDGKYFVPTPRMSRLALGYTGTPLPTLAQTCLNEIRDQTGKSASLAVLEDGYALFVARAEVRELVSASVRLGSRLPAHTSSNGRILLAALSAERLEEELSHLRPATGAKGRIAHNEIHVRKRVLETRDLGYSTSDEELEYGVRTLAVPVRDSYGVVHAAMSISAFAHEISIKELVAKNLKILQQASKRLGSML